MILGGNYTADGKVKEICGHIGWAEVLNLKTGKLYKWQIGMADGKGFDTGTGEVAKDGFTFKTPKEDMQSVQSIPNQITAITKAKQAVVTFKETPTAQVGDIMRFSIPPAFKMVELDNQKGTVVAVDADAKTVTIDIDTSSYTAFVAATKGIATASYSGYRASCDGLCGPFRGSGSAGSTCLELGTAVAGASGDVVFWRAGFLQGVCECQ